MQVSFVLYRLLSYNFKGLNGFSTYNIVGHLMDS